MSRCRSQRARRSSCSAPTAPARDAAAGAGDACCARTPGACACSGASLPEEAWAVRGRIGLLGHEPLLYRELTARENLRFHARLHGVGEARVEELLEARGDGATAATSRCGRSRAGWSSAWRSRARCCTTPSCCCWTSPTPTSTRPRSSWCAPLIGAASGRTRVICSHDPSGGLAEADLVLGLRAGRGAALLRGAPARASLRARQTIAELVPGEARRSARCCARSCWSSCARSSRCRACRCSR